MLITFIHIYGIGRDDKGRKWGYRIVLTLTAQMWPSERVIMFQFAKSAREAHDRDEKEKAPGEIVEVVYPNKSDVVPEAVHEVFHD